MYPSAFRLLRSGRRQLANTGNRSGANLADFCFGDFLPSFYTTKWGLLMSRLVSFLVT
jgi:hypothetical protein